MPGNGSHVFPSVEREVIFFLKDVDVFVDMEILRNVSELYNGTKQYNTTVLLVHVTMQKHILWFREDPGSFKVERNNDLS